jgi:hypothetical protein
MDLLRRKKTLDVTATIQALAYRAADRITALAGRGDLGS